MTDTMTHLEFQRLLDSFGANLSRWPDDVQAAAHAYIASFPHDHALHQAHDEANALDRWLDTSEPVKASDLLKQRILLASLDAGHRPTHDFGQTVSSRPQKKASYYRTAAIVAASFSLGFVGSDILNSPTPPQEVAQIEPVEFASEDYSSTLSAQSEWSETAELLGLEDVYAWVEGNDI